ncbi:carbon dioxide concentrating mechanism protein [Gloeothece verrucosa]|uniref:Carbon dioxide concentrating mechanism protein n=1 Tax=Gloeothece verrucosa (strain PCC 7822) TaxID=497965 RepID=E0U7P4_GLOV7|nr:carbon dioxide concentrating mechanism protein [Gloeothece verrucosa]ADN14856.1 carbon dioxide concentrating mechanism protein [Gloeothece verrucosa PCC 7822]
MHLPPVQPVSVSEIYVSGDVIIHDSAVVAPGTILQAAPNSRIVIGAGACIGMGVVLNAYRGEIEIESGAVLGSGVLILGTGKIGKNACVGSLTTLLNSSIEPMAVITAGSLIGDTTRSFTPEPETTNGNGAKQPDFSKLNRPEKIQEELPPIVASPPKEHPSVVELESDPWTIDPIDDDQSSSKSDSVLSNTQVHEPEPATETRVEVTPQPPDLEPTEQSKQAPVVGQIYINQLLLTLFPERRFFQNLDQKNQSLHSEENSQ